LAHGAGPSRATRNAQIGAIDRGAFEAAVAQIRDAEMARLDLALLRAL
jgi:hypothetical protein